LCLLKDWLDLLCVAVTDAQGKVIPKEITREGLMTVFWNVWQNLTTSEVNYSWCLWLRLWKKECMWSVWRAGSVMWMLRKSQLENLKWIDQLLTYSLSYFLTFLLTFLLTYLLSYYLPSLLIYLLTYFLAYLLTYFLAYLLTFLLTYLLTYLLLTYLFTYLFI